MLEYDSAAAIRGSLIGRVPDSCDKVHVDRRLSQCGAVTSVLGTMIQAVQLVGRKIRRITESFGLEVEIHYR